MTSRGIEDIVKSLPGREKRRHFGNCDWILLALPENGLAKLLELSRVNRLIRIKQEVALAKCHLGNRLIRETNKIGCRM